MDPNVRKYLEKLSNWSDEISRLREIVLDCGLEEGFKWMHPCYMLNKKNVVLIHEFKDYCAISFFKGVLLKDPDQLLIQPTENMQSQRQLRFTSLDDIENKAPLISSYVLEAIEIERAGLKVELKKTAEFDIPEELESQFNNDRDFKAAFYDLTPGRQRGYLLHFSKPKKSETRESRIEQYRDRIMLGKGLRDCICGQSKRMPNCDGSHKHLENTG